MPKFADKIVLRDDSIEVDGEEFPWYVGVDVFLQPGIKDEKGNLTDIPRLHINIPCDELVDERVKKAANAPS